MSTRADRMAEEVLFPAAANVDATGRVPARHFDTLAEQGFYAFAAPTEVGGPGLNPAEAGRILEILASGCLTTTFTWLQHHSLVLSLLGTDRAELREHHLDAALRGVLRGGIATSGAIPPTPTLVAEPTDDGFLINGEAPFVSGWGLVDLLCVAARHENTVVNGLIDARTSEHLSAEALDLGAATGTNTVRLRFTDYLLPIESVTGRSDYADFLAGLAFGVRFNGSLPLGLVRRCAWLIEQGGRAEVAGRFRREADTVRQQLDSGLANDTDTLSLARARAGELAIRAAAALVTVTGSRAILVGEHGQRLLREATFTLVAGSRPAIKDGLIDLLTSAA